MRPWTAGQNRFSLRFSQIAQLKTWSPDFYYGMRSACSGVRQVVCIHANGGFPELKRLAYAVFVGIYGSVLIKPA
jgi:hypothetical protein